MSKSERVREQIAYLKFWLGILAALTISLVGWLLSHFDVAPWPVLVGGVVALVSFAAGIRGLHQQIERRIDQLEDL
ncbi:hypothetical protein T5B8_03586 [Salinisphaera sp. T5B8]|uniref:hypothetical protein n=1 Tax=Salinisphaera sp. T5B8 TaxID=1304154 RepID=UPI00333EDA89